MSETATVTSAEMAKVVYSADLFQDSRKIRAVLDHGDGRFSLTVLNKADSKSERTVRAAPESTFDMDELAQVAIAGMCGDPIITQDKMNGKKLAAGVLLLMIAMGLVTPQEAG